MSDFLKSAQKKLSIKNVLIHKCSFSLGDDVDIFDVNTDSNVQGFNSVTNVTILEPKKESELFFYIFYYSLGIRILDLNSKENINNNRDESVILTITSVLSVIYSSNEKLIEDEIKEFSKNNVGYYAWPYWREIVQSSCVRMGISPIDMPPYQIKK